MPKPKTVTKIRVAIHSTLVLVFIAIWIVAVPTGWIKSVTFVSHMSMAALVYAAASAAEASVSALKIDKQNENGSS
jgi:hypothetical protein